jgi:ketosteroid isomerase-like protein
MFRFLLVALLTTWLCLAAMPVAAQANQEEAVNQLLNRIEQAWDNRDIAALGACYSDVGMLVITAPPGRPEGAWIGGKQQALEGIAKAWGEIESHRFVEREIAGDADFAWMVLCIADKVSGKGLRTTRVAAIAMRQGNEWKMCFGMPLIARLGVFVTSVAKGSRSEALGIQPGDRLITYADQEVKSAKTFMESVEAPSRVGQDRPIPLILRRGPEEFRFNVEPGRPGFGLQVADRILPIEGATLVDVDQPHSVKECVQEEIRGMMTGDVERALTFACPAGFLVPIRAENGKPARLVTRENMRELFAEAIQGFRQSCDLSTLEFKDHRLIVSGDVAISAGRVEAMKRNRAEGKLSVLSSFEIYVRQKGQWWWVGSLPCGLKIGPPPR